MAKEGQNEFGAGLGILYILFLVDLSTVGYQCILFYWKYSS